MADLIVIRKVQRNVGDNNNFTTTFFMNQRFLLIGKHHGPLLFNRWRKETEIVDRKTKEVLAREIDFYTSHEKPQAGWNGWKMWLYREHCGTYVHRDAGDMSPIATELEGR